MLVAQTVVGSRPSSTQISTNAYRHVCKYVDQKGSTAMLTSIQSAGVAPEVNLRNSLYAGEEACKRGIHPGFETQGRRHQKSKTGVSVAPPKGYMSSKNFKKSILKLMPFLTHSLTPWWQYYVQQTSEPSLISRTRWPPRTSPLRPLAMRPSVWQEHTAFLRRKVTLRSFIRCKSMIIIVPNNTRKVMIL